MSLSSVNQPLYTGNKKRHIRKKLGVNCAYVSELPSTPGLGKRRIVSEKNLFETYIAH